MDPTRRSSPPPARTHRPWARRAGGALALLAVGLLACQPEAPPPAPADGPRFVVLGPEAGAPTGIVAQFPTPVQAALDAEGDGVRWSMTPPLPGAVRFAGPAAVSFEPEAPWAPGQRYTFEIKEIRGSKGALTPPAPWRTTVQAPDFALLDVSAGHLDPRRGRLPLTVRFTAAVDPARFVDYATWTVDGHAPSLPIDAVAGDDPSQIAVTISDGALRPGAEIALALRAGLPHAQGQTAPAAAHTLTVGAPAAWRVLSVYPVETDAGFSLQVVCDDPAAGQPRRVWDAHLDESVRLSHRCLPDEETVRQQLRVVPPVAVQVTRDRLGFRLEGPFSHGPYTLHIAAGARTVDGAALPAAARFPVTVPRRSPEVQILAQGRYLPRAAWGALAVSHRNTPTLRLTVHHIPPRNVSHWLGRWSEAPTDRTADQVVAVDIPVTSAPDALGHTTLDLRRWLPTPAPGLYAVDVAAGGAHDARRIAVTDLQLVYKRSRGADGGWGGQVWALDAATGAPRDGVAVDLVRVTGTPLAQCRTRGEAGCRLAPATPGAGPPVAIFARHGADFTWLDLDRLDTAAHGDRWGATPSAAAWTVAPWTDRGVYRPGDAVRLAALVRDRSEAAPTAGLPVTLVLTDARDRAVRREVARTNPAGLVTWTLPIGADAPTGRWRAELHIADTRVAQVPLPVEAIVPERLAVTLTPEAPSLLGDGPARFTVAARYLFGGSAAGARASLRCQHSPQRPAPALPTGDPVAADLRAQVAFGPIPGEATDLGTVEATLDSSGQATLTCPAGDAAAAPGVIYAEAAISEGGGGRVSRAHARVTRRLGRWAVGLQPPEGPVAPGALTVTGLALGWDGLPTADGRSVTVRAVQIESVIGWRLDPATGVRRRAHTTRETVAAEAKAIVRAGRFDVALTLAQPAARWRLEAQVEDAVAAVAAEGTLDAQAWRWSADAWSARSDHRTPGPAQPDPVRIEPPAQVDVGREAVATVHSPYAGRALLTVEADEIHTARWVDVVAGPNRFPFTIKQFTPNVYLGAFVLRPQDPDQPGWRPSRAAAVLSVPVDPGPRALRPSLAVPEAVRPNQPLTIAVDAGRAGAGAFAVVAAVDEGLLQLTEFKSPDPNALLFARRALRVDTYDTWGWGFTQPAGGRTSAPGGGAGEGGGLEAVVKPVALWQGPVALDAQGQGTVTFDVPAYQGRLRIMAVVADARRAGAAEAAVVVRDPLGLTVSAPLTLVAGDRAVVPVFVHNLTQAPQAITARLTADAGIERVGPETRTVTLAPGEGQPVAFEVRATGRDGQGVLAVEVSSAAHRSTDTRRITLRPRGVRHEVVDRQALAPGETLTLAPSGAFLPGTEGWTVLASATPDDDSFTHLRGLIEYPHGCLEQTSSRLRPLLALGTLVEDLGAAGPRSLAPLVQAGVARLWQMQTADGGFAYWPGGPVSHPWGTPYAVMLLQDAEAAGYPVDRDRLGLALDWVAQRLDAGALPPLAAAWGHAALARGGRAQLGALRRLVEGLPQPLLGTDRERAALLWSALYRAGDRRHGAALKALVAAPAERDGPRRTFWSVQRGEAVALAEAVAVLGADPALAPGAAALAAHLRGRDTRTLTTPELGWTLAALGRWRTAQAELSAPPVVEAAGAAVAPSGVARWTLPGGAAQVRAAADASDPTWITVLRRGVAPPESAWTGHAGLRLTHTLLDAEGQPIDPTAVRLGQLVFSRLTVQNPSAEAVPHVALVAALPAGLSVEPGRLGRVATPAWADGEAAWQVSHVDARDDRFAAYGALPARTTVQVVHALRATAAGTFHAPGAEVEAMYAPDRRARLPAGELTIVAPFPEHI